MGQSRLTSSPSDFQAHLHLWELLPFLLNGTASASEREELERHLSACHSCRAELAFQQCLYAAMKAPTAPVGPDVDAGLARLFERIEALPRPRPRARRVRRHGSMSMLGVAVGVLLVLGAGGAAWLRSLLGSAERPAVYRKVSPRTQFFGKARSRRATIRLVADASLPMGRLETQLASLGLRIVSGPSATGIFLLAPASGAGEGDVVKQLAALRAAPGVRFAEAIVPSRP